MYKGKTKNNATSMQKEENLETNTLICSAWYNILERNLFSNYVKL